MLYLVMHSLGMRLVMHNLFLFLQCQLLRTKTNGKTNAETKLLANVTTSHCTSKAGKQSQGPLLPNTTICCYFSTFNLGHTSGSSNFTLSHPNLNIAILCSLFFRRPLPLLILRFLMMMNLDLHGVTFFLLFHPALRHVLALLCVLCVASLLILRAADLGIFSRALLGGLAVASLSWFVPTLLRVLGLALLIVLIVALLFMLGVALLLVYCLTQLFIFSLALRVIFSLAGGAVLSLALILVLLHAHLFMFGLTVGCYNIFPLQMTFWLLEFLLKMISHSCKKATACRCKK